MTTSSGKRKSSSRSPATAYSATSFALRAHICCNIPRVSMRSTWRSTDEASVRHVDPMLLHVARTQALNRHLSEPSIAYLTVVFVFDLGLDFYGWVKLINYARKEVSISSYIL